MPVLNSQSLAQYWDSFDADLKKVASSEDLEQLRRDWLSKEGTLKRLFADLREVAAEDKPKVAEGLNELRDRIEAALSDSTERLRVTGLQAKLRSTFIDLSLPSQSTGLGALHPVTRVEERFLQILKPFGVEAVFGPEVETEFYCFDALNIPKHHPARDMQDTFFTESGHVLRTHTTSVQARVLEERGKLKSGRLPVKVASCGRVYRNETEDASHTAMFHQFELIWVEEGITLANLMALIEHMLKELYGKRRRVRFVPKFYPYTEPSIGAQIDCTACKAAGCSLCGGSGWSTIVGAGMIHRNVLREFGYDPEIVSGFAFGFGTTRLAAQMFGFTRIRDIYSNDLRTLKTLV